MVWERGLGAGLGGEDGSFHGSGTENIFSNVLTLIHYCFEAVVHILNLEIYTREV